MKTKILLWSVVSILTVGMAKDTHLLSKSDRAQIITLSDGTKLTLLGTTYGDYHVAPKYGHLHTGNWIRSSNSTTVVWVEAVHKLKHRPSYELLISDRANTACVPIEAKSSSHVKDGVDVQGFVLNVFPRWDKETILRARLYRGAVSREQFVISNPPHGSLTNWTPKLLPNTQSDGDIVVTLTNFVVGAPLPHRRGNDLPLNDPVNQCVRLGFDLKQNGQSVTNWRPWLVETSDATGNHIRGVVSDYPQDGFYDLPRGRIEGYFYRPGLWPREPAWKVRLEFTRTSGFDDHEILTLTNIPVQIGTEEERDAQWTWEAGDEHLAFTDYFVNGVQLKLFPPILHPAAAQPGKMFLSVIMRPNPNPERSGMRMTLIQATDEQGRELWSPFTPHAGYNCSINFPDPRRDIKSLNLKFALHKSRHLEFLVKPMMR